MDHIKLSKLLERAVEQMMQEDDSAATQQAHDLGLVSKGWGRWADPNTGQVVANTIQGQLVKVADVQSGKVDVSKGGAPQQKGPITQPRHAEPQKQFQAGVGKYEPSYGSSDNKASPSTPSGPWGDNPQKALRDDPDGSHAARNSTAADRAAMRKSFGMPEPTEP